MPASQMYLQQSGCFRTSYYISSVLQTKMPSFQCDQFFLGASPRVNLLLSWEPGRQALPWQKRSCRTWSKGLLETIRKNTKWKNSHVNHSKSIIHQNPYKNLIRTNRPFTVPRRFSSAGASLQLLGRMSAKLLQHPHQRHPLVRPLDRYLPERSVTEASSKNLRFSWWVLGIYWENLKKEDLVEICVFFSFWILCQVAVSHHYCFSSSIGELWNFHFMPIIRCHPYQTPASIQCILVPRSFHPPIFWALGNSEWTETPWLKGNLMQHVHKNPSKDHTTRPAPSNFNLVSWPSFFWEPSW